MQNIGVVTVLLLLGAFALERLLAGANFLLGPEPAADRADELRRRKVLLFALAGAVALAVVDRNSDLRIVQLLQPGHRPTPFDYWLTWLVLVAGSDQVKTVMGWISGNAGSAKDAKVPLVRIEPDTAVNIKQAA